MGMFRFDMKNLHVEYRFRKSARRKGQYDRCDFKLPFQERYVSDVAHAPVGNQPQD